MNSGEEGEVLSLHARELRVLERIAEAGTQIASMEELIDHACHIVLDSFDFDLVGIGVPDEKEGLLKLRYAVRGLADRIQKFSLPLNRIMGRSDLKQRLLYGFKDNERDHYFLSSEANIQSSLNVPVEVQERVIGFIIAESLNCKRLNGTHERLLKNVANQLALAIDHSRTYDDTLEGWVRALDLRDKETEDHTRRVVESTLRMARRMGTREEDLVHVRRGALLHDIGKLGVPDHILHKPGPLNDEELVVMQQHPLLAYDMIAPIHYLNKAIDIPLCHHEKWDGSGYPYGISGEKIPLSARIFAVIDVWDALTYDRPYRKAWTEEEAIAYIQEQSGKHFDPQVVEEFVKMIEVDKALLSYGSSHAEDEMG